MNKLKCTEAVFDGVIFLKLILIKPRVYAQY